MPWTCDVLGEPQRRPDGYEFGDGVELGCVFGYWKIVQLSLCVGVKLDLHFAGYAL